MRMQHGIAADGDVLTDGDECADGGVLTDLRRRRDGRGGMDARRGARRLVEEFQSAGEIVVGIRGEQSREARHRVGREDGAGARVLQFVGVARVGEEREMSLAGLLHAEDAGDFERRIALQRAPQGGGKFV